MDPVTQQLQSQIKNLMVENQALNQSYGDQLNINFNHKKDLIDTRQTLQETQKSLEEAQNEISELKDKLADSLADHGPHEDISTPQSEVVDTDLMEMDSQAA